LEVRPLDIQFIAPPDRDEAVAEIWSGEARVCEISIETGDPVVKIDPNPAGGAWVLDFDAFLNALSQAGHRLLAG
jgi:hypothetical protein